MSIKHSTVTVSTTETAITSPVADKTGNNYDVARSAVVTNLGAASVFLGGPGVTTAAYGYELKGNSEIALDLGPTDALFGVVASATSTVRVLHLGV